jgi:hypothetical protein
MKRSALVAFWILIFSIILSAHGDEKHVMGTVAKVAGNSITVTTTSGNSTVVTVADATKFLKGHSPASLQDLKVGDRVVIHAKLKGQALEATEVRIGSSPTASGKP